MGTLNTNLSTYKFIISICIFLLGILILVAIQSPLRYFGIVLIMATIIYFSSVLFGFAFQSNPEKFKSHIREEILRHQHKK